MNANEFDHLEVIRADVAARLRACASFRAAGVAVVEQGGGDLAGMLKSALARRGRAARRPDDDAGESYNYGLAFIVGTPIGGGEGDTGKLIAATIDVFAIENPEVNASDAGTGISAGRAAGRAIALLAGYRSRGICSDLALAESGGIQAVGVAQEGAREAFTGFRLRFQFSFDFSEGYAQAPAPSIAAADGAATITRDTSYALWYRLGGGYPERGHADTVEVAAGGSGTVEVDTADGEAYQIRAVQGDPDESSRTNDSDCTAAAFNP